MGRPFLKLLPWESSTALRWWALLGVLVAIGQVVDPLEGASQRQLLLFWTGRLVAYGASVILAEWVIERLLSEQLQKPPWLKPVVMVTLALCLPLAAAELLLESIAPQRAEYDDSVALEDWPFGAFIGEYLTIVSLLLPVNLILWIVIEGRSGIASAAVEPIDPSIPQPAFLDKAGGIGLEDVIALEADEHYVRVHSLNGQDLIHHRLGDAVGEMPAAMGLRVHRSWWVAESAVQSARRVGRRYQLTLTNGLTVPVSDSFTAAARERGLLRRKPARTTS